MSKVKKSSLELIGNTPLLEIRRYAKAKGIDKATIFAKLE